MIKTSLQKLFLCIASCASFTAFGMTVDTLSPDFQYVVKVTRPCKVEPDTEFQVMYTMQNDGEIGIAPVTLTLGERTLFFPAVRTLIDLTGAELVTVEADEGTQFIATPGFDFGRWELTQPEGLEPGEVKQLTLTLRVESAEEQVNFFVQGQRNNFTTTCRRQITIPVEDDTTCPVSPTTTIRAQIGTFVRPGTITFPNQAFVDETFVVEYTVTNDQPRDALELLYNVFPNLVDSEGTQLFEVVSVEASPGSIVDMQKNEYPSGRGVGSWQTPELAMGESAFLRITLRPTRAAVGLLAYTLRVEGNPPCTFGPVQIDVTLPPVPPPDNPDAEVCPILTDPVARALASILPSIEIG